MGAYAYKPLPGPDVGWPIRAGMAAKFTMSVPGAMKVALEEERRRRKLDSIQETIRSILSEYFSGLSKR